MLLVCDNIGHECSTAAAGKHVGEYWRCWASSCDQWSTPCRQCQCWWSSWYRIEPRTTAGADLTFFLLVFWICTVYTSFCWYFSKCEIVAANEHGHVHLVECVKPVLFVSEMKLDRSLFMLTIFLRFSVTCIRELLLSLWCQFAAWYLNFTIQIAYTDAIWWRCSDGPSVVILFRWWLYIMF